MDKTDDYLMKIFLRTGDPFYYTARGVLRENGANGKNTGDSDFKNRL